MLATAQTLAASALRLEYDVDDAGVTSKNAILPPLKELLLGSIASIIVFVALWKLAGPPIRDAMKARTERIQKELDDAAAARAAAEKEADEIRTALGDIDAERTRLFDEADEQAEQLLSQGRERLDQEVADMEAKADADIASAADRGTEDLRADISRYASRSIDDAVRSSLDDQTQQQLIEDFISRVGSQGANA